MARPLTLAVAGDVMLGRLVDRVIPHRGFRYPWGDVLPRLRDADLFLANLECALTAHTREWHDGGAKVFYFRADPSVVRTLEIAGVDYVSLANNHSCDFDTPGLLETVQVLDRAGIAHSGAGADLAAARAPARLEADGLRVAVVAFADYPMAWAATETSPGINYTPVSVDPEDFRAVEGALAAARDGADFVVFSIHWGPNMRARPPRSFRTFARRVMDAGADLFWGHSAHVVQGIEVYRDKPILYDTGDFVDDYAVDPELRNDLSALFLVRLRPPAVERVDLVPVRIGDLQVNLARGADREWIVRRLTALSGEMGTAATPVPDGLSVPVQEVRAEKDGGA